MPQNQNKLDEIPTPLTDAIVEELPRAGHGGLCKMADFARQLERTNAELLKDKERRE